MGVGADGNGMELVYILHEAQTYFYIKGTTQEGEKNLQKHAYFGDSAPTPISAPETCPSELCLVGTGFYRGFPISSHV